MLKKYLSLFSIFILYTYNFAQVTPPAPPASAAATSGGIWAPGTMDPATTPIDDYTIYLIGFAILIAVTYFAVKKYKKSLI